MHLKSWLNGARIITISLLKLKNEFICCQSHPGRRAHCPDHFSTIYVYIFVSTNFKHIDWCCLSFCCILYTSSKKKRPNAHPGSVFTLFNPGTFFHFFPFPARIS
ncbi:TPA: hypothetical protein JBD08_12390 [Legionella pneumophila subsp. pneumophila]|nr:hypothetical protein DM454_12145 [Legionella pneumophila]HAT8682277.1 hypothetical protein [Legionella pneumophila subsp. pneumophila ATCC 43283]HAT8844447.1 hypothetical protein [Legionella pneumophila subsp. pneumophila]PYB48398.1 hypothetical protein DM456_13525 [Legionella pneumophila]PYB60971.1 hypothetical protein DM455_12100 [Legionella pneumophila]